MFTSLFTILLWTGDSEETFRSSTQPAHLSTTHDGGFTLSLLIFIGEAVNINFCSRLFDPTGNRTRIYQFSSSRLTTARLRNEIDAVRPMLNILVC